MNRRNFLKLGVVAAPAVILTPGLLMPVKSLASILRYTHAEYGLGLKVTLGEAGFANALWPGVKMWWDEVYGIEVKKIELLYKDLYKDA